GKYKRSRNGERAGRVGDRDIGQLIRHARPAHKRLNGIVVRYSEVDYRTRRETNRSRSQKTYAVDGQSGIAVVACPRRSYRKDLRTNGYDRDRKAACNSEVRAVGNHDGEAVGLDFSRLAGNDSHRIYHQPVRQIARR